MKNFPLFIILFLSSAIAVISTQQKFEIFKVQPLVIADEDVDLMLTQVAMFQ